MDESMKNRQLLKHGTFNISVKNVLCGCGKITSYAITRPFACIICYHLSVVGKKETKIYVLFSLLTCFVNSAYIFVASSAIELL